MLPSGVNTTVRIKLFSPSDITHEICGADNVLPHSRPRYPNRIVASGSGGLSLAFSQCGATPPRMGILTRRRLWRHVSLPIRSRRPVIALGDSSQMAKPETNAIRFRLVSSEKKLLGWNTSSVEQASAVGRDCMIRSS